MNSITSEVLRPYIGKTGEPRGLAVDRFRSVSAVVATHTIPKLRSLKYRGDGNEIAKRVGKGEYLQNGSPAVAHDFYFRVAEEGIESRETQKERPYRYIAAGFTRIWRNRLGFTRKDLQMCIAAMKADAAVTDYLEPDRMVGSRAIFVRVANQYIDAYTKPHKAHLTDFSEDVIEIAELWNNNRTINGFYRALYQKTERAGLASWQPFQVGFDYTRYEMLRRGIEQFSAFDGLALEAAAGGCADEVSRWIREETGLHIGKDVIYFHAGVLLGRKSITNAILKPV